jgi:hypothetical protein
MTIKKTAVKKKTPKLDAIPEGFEEVKSANVDGYYVCRAGNTVTGRLVATYLTKTKFLNKDSAHPGKKRAYKIQLTAGTTIVTSADKDSQGEELEVSEGALISIDEKGFLQKLGDVAIGRLVYIVCLGKEKPSKEYPQGAWRFVVAQASDPDGTDPETSEIEGEDSDE